MIVDHPVEREEVDQLLQKRVAFKCRDLRDWDDIKTGMITGILNVEELYHFKESKVYRLGFVPVPFRIPLLIKLDSVYRFDGEIFDGKDGTEELHESFRYVIIEITQYTDLNKILSGEKTDNECFFSLIKESESINRRISLEEISNRLDEPCEMNHMYILTMSKECQLCIID